MLKRSSSRLAVALLALGFAVPSSLAQKAKPSDQQDPSEKPRNVKPELKKAYKDWLEKDVTYIITDEERKAFKKLETDEERERFIEEFWRRRDPDPDHRAGSPEPRAIDGRSRAAQAAAQPARCRRRGRARRPGPTIANLMKAVVRLRPILLSAGFIVTCPA